MPDIDKGVGKMSQMRVAVEPLPGAQEFLLLGLVGRQTRVSIAGSPADESRRDPGSQRGGNLPGLDICVISAKLPFSFVAGKPH